MTNEAVQKLNGVTSSGL